MFKNGRKTLCILFHIINFRSDDRYIFNTLIDLISKYFEDNLFILYTLLGSKMYL